MTCLPSQVHRRAGNLAYWQTPISSVHHSDVFVIGERRSDGGKRSQKRSGEDSLEQGILLPSRIQFKPFQGFPQLGNGGLAGEPIWHSCAVGLTESFSLLLWRTALRHKNGRRNSYHDDPQTRSLNSVPDLHLDRSMFIFCSVFPLGTG